MDENARARPAEGLLLRLVGGVAPLLFRLLHRSWSIRVLNRRVLDEYINGGRPLIAVIWHQNVIPGVAFFGYRRPVIMVSRSKDGELIARVSGRLGFRHVRGSSSRGGKEALAELVDWVRAGGQSAITVDGPKGPFHDPKMGCVLAARSTGAPIIPIAAWARPAVRARSWDRTLIPLPFAQLVLAFGEPIRLGPDASGEECESARLQVREALDRAEAAARAATEPPSS